MSWARATEQERDEWHAARARHGRGRHDHVDLCSYVAAYGPYSDGIALVADLGHGIIDVLGAR